ncbi:30S ribosomal protein S15 [Buchnera aphidicola]|uniref:Small ribosomal subunit protein uS15 n=1 Tax=Buchnera aphidicola subsp. Cinara cedri (strain Cc) TaxID=372461 RepID=RS15_BUCCC|nr:30S ribosomal protein S15 [Buchnera aphidicola]Q057K2.1 RecName: Full=Small ribosomal subunit protein uS15; AltName: Full=30S ribosomal protein S15 [Buchnera aphidicola BCc]ABJ90697.1 30S ribosomal protein S15 [Buchnera aphidicola BCc]
MLKDTLKVKNLVMKYGKSYLNTGSSSVQIALLTRKINYLQKHFILHKEDHCGRKGLLNMVSRRRKLLDYLKSNQYENYLFLIKKLGLRH